MSTAHHKEATSVGHTNTFHPLEVKRNEKKKQLAEKETVVQRFLCSAPAGPRTPTCASVPARENMVRGTAGRRGSEGVLC